MNPLACTHHNTESTECQLCACGCGETLRKGTTRRFKRGHYRFIPDQHIADPETGCWVWTGKINSRGYGLTRDDQGRTAHAHRLYWESVHGTIPQGMIVVQTCDNKLCCNPEHMELRSAGAEQSARCREMWAAQKADPSARIIGKPTQAKPGEASQVHHTPGIPGPTGHENPAAPVAVPDEPAPSAARWGAGEGAGK